MSCRIKYHKKESFNIDQKMRDLEKRREKLLEDNKNLKHLENGIEINIKTQKSAEIKYDQNTNNITEIKSDINKEEKNYTKINNEK